MELNPIDHIKFDAGKLHSEFPPRWRHDNKRLVYQIGCWSGVPFEGDVVYARWPALELPADIPSKAPFSVKPGLFAYEEPDDSKVVDWHLNFADPDLFVAYGSPLFAQDELQVAEHPILGSIREALIAKGMRASTVDQQGNPTPVTITGVQRRCAFNTQPINEAGQTSSLYGNAFSRASEEQVKRATQVLSPPTISNILAIAAPAGGYGEYSREQIINVLVTAYTGFGAARSESQRLINSEARTVIHTGFWGCGAFGGNRELMTILQGLAGDLAGVEIVFWAFDEDGMNLASDARHRYKQMLEDDQRVDGLLDRLVEMKFLWGVSDGN